MKVLTRYLLRAHVGPFFFAFVALTGVILINTLARTLADLAGKGLSTEVILRFFVLSLPANVALTFPMAVLVAVLYSFSQMAAENEVTALKASGIDLRRLMLPLLAVAVLITGTMIWFNDTVLPEANHRWRVLMGDVARKSPLLTLREQAVNVIPNPNGLPRYFLQASHINQRTNGLRDVTIYDLGDVRTGRTIYADSGRVALTPDLTQMYLTLFDGHVRELSFNEPQNFQRLEFQRQLLRMDVGTEFELSADTATRFRGDREMTIAMLQAKVDTARAEIARARHAPPSAGMGPEYLKMLQRDIRSSQVEIHKKYSIAVASLVFVLLGAPLAVRFPRGGIGVVLAISLAVFALYYVGLIGGETLADRGYLPPVLAMWMMNLLMGVVGGVALWRMGRERVTNRGGGEGLRGLLGRLGRRTA